MYWEGHIPCVWLLCQDSNDLGSGMTWEVGMAYLSVVIVCQ